MARPFPHVGGQPAQPRRAMARQFARRCDSSCIAPIIGFPCQVAKDRPASALFVPNLCSSHNDKKIKNAHQTQTFAINLSGCHPSTTEYPGAVSTNQIGNPSREITPTVASCEESFDITTMVLKCAANGESITDTTTHIALRIIETGKERHEAYTINRIS
jgi:hypothetical protein